jgi:hypothetical protein
MKKTVKSKVRGRIHFGDDDGDERLLSFIMVAQNITFSIYLDCTFLAQY